MACSLQRRNVWPKLPAVMWLRAELQGASLLPTRPLRLLLCQRLVREPLWERLVPHHIKCLFFLSYRNMYQGVITYFLPLFFILCMISFCFLLVACHNDMYGPDCTLSCKCQNGGVCNRFSGCQCPTGWRGQNCEKSGRYRNYFHINPSFFFIFILFGMESIALILYIYSHRYTQLNTIAKPCVSIQVVSS